MLKRIRLTDFKSFADEQIELAPLTLLVGANASGKSNFLDAIRFLQGLVFDLTLSEVLNGERNSGPDAWPGIRGRAEEVARMGKEAFSIDSTWLARKVGSRPAKNVDLILDSVEMQHHIACTTVPSPALEEESLDSSGQGVEAGLKTTEARLRDDFRVDQLHGKPLVVGGKGNLLRILENGQSKLRPANRWLLVRWNEALRKLSFLEIGPSGMRDYGRRGFPLGDEGTNISGVLADLCEESGEKASLVHWLVELCAPEIEDIDFVEVKELGDVMAMFVEKGGRRISARSVSDGTLHFLGTLLALRTAEPGSVILIEEIEAGLHPTRIRLLVEYLEAVTRERRIQVIATTHSPVVLQWLSDESLRSTIVFGRTTDHEGTIMRRLGDLPHFEEVVQRKGIDDLFTTGWLEMAL